MSGRNDGLMPAVARVALPLAALVMVIGGCQHRSGPAASPAPMSGRETVITEEEIARMSVRTAWDAVRLRAPRFMSGVDPTGRSTPPRIQAQRSINADETPLLVVDGQQVSDVLYLNQIPASQIHAIHILDAEAAEPLYGLRAAGGAIVVETKGGRS